MFAISLFFGSSVNQCDVVVNFAVSLGTAMPQIRVIWVKAETSISVLRWWSLRTQSTSANAILLYSQIFQILIFKQNTLFGLDGLQGVHCGHKFAACKRWPIFTLQTRTLRSWEVNRLVQGHLVS